MITTINRSPKINSSFSLAVVFLTLNFTFITIPVIIKASPTKGRIVIAHYPNSMCHSMLMMNKLILTTSLFVLALIGFFLRLNIYFSFLQFSLSKVSSLTLCIYYTTKVVLNQEILLTFFKKNKRFFPIKQLHSISLL